MAYTNLTKLQEIQPLNLTIGDLSSAQAAVTTVTSTSQNEVGNFWFNGSIFLLFLILNWYFYRKDANIQLDISRAILTSAGWCFFISTAFLLSGLVTTIYPLYWFSTLTLVSWLSVQSLKDKGA